MYFDDDFFLIVLLVGSALLLAPIAFFVALSARRRVRALERNFAELTALIARMASLSSSAPPSGGLSEEFQESASRRPDELERVAMESSTEHPVIPNSSASVASVSEGPTWIERFFAWYREDWMQKTGAIVVFFGFLWLVGYLNIWEAIGPAGQVTVGLLSGAAFLVFGWWRTQRFVTQGGTFMILGSGIVLLTVYITGQVYPSMFTPIVGSAIMLASVAFIALASVTYDRKPLAFTAQVMAFLIPLLTGPGGDEYLLFTYLLLVTIGTLWVVWYKGWRDLIVAALVFVGLYSLPSWDTLSDERLLLFGYLFSAVFFIAFAISIVRRGPSPHRAVDIVAILGNGVFITMWILAGVDKEWQSLVLAFWAVLFAAGAYVTSMVAGRRDPFYLHGAVAIAMLGAATAAELDGASLTIAFTLEIALLALAAHVYTKRIEVAEKLSLLFVIPGVMSLAHLGKYAASFSLWGAETPLFGEEFFAIAIFIAALIGVGGYIRAQRSSENEVKFGPALLGIGSIYGLIFFWYFIHKAFAGDSMATLIALILYTILGISLYVAGRAGSSVVLGWFGKGLILFVLARIFLIDFWSLEIATRIIVSFCVGALLMATAFLRKK
jgi:uncharacterized membrane protein